MKQMALWSTRLTPIIGLGLAVVVAGSLILFAVMAQRITLQTPLGASLRPVAPQSEPAQAVQIGSEEAKGRARRGARQQEARVLGKRIQSDRVNQATTDTIEPRSRDRSTDRPKAEAERTEDVHDPQGKARGHEKARGAGHHREPHGGKGKRRDG